MGVAKLANWKDGYCGQEVGRLHFASGGSKIMGAYIAQGVTVGLDG